MPSAKPHDISAIVPVRNAMGFLRDTAPALIAAAEHHGNVEVLFVDDGSIDGSREYLRSLAGPGRCVLSQPGVSIAAVRNYGARQSTGRVICFIDADCLVGTDYFEAAEGALRSSAVHATGCTVDLPDAPHWIEAAWHRLHHVARDREVHYINSGNFVVTREAFEAVGGFREDLPTGEDAELGQRLRARGFRIVENGRVRAIHLGNPKSLRAFYRRSMWHGLGALGTVRRGSVDKPVVMSIAHLLSSLGGVALLAGNGSFPRLIGAVGFQVLAPAAAVAYRIRQTRQRPPLLTSLLLYWLYFWARIQALLLVMLGRTGWYWK